MSEEVEITQAFYKGRVFFCNTEGAGLRVLYSTEITEDSWPVFFNYQPEEDRPRRYVFWADSWADAKARYSASNTRTPATRSDSSLPGPGDDQHQSSA